VKFNVIVGNPPYQVSAAEGTNRTLPVYHHFVERAIDLDPRYVVMIVPSRWFTGGFRLDEFRANMIADRRIRALVDNPLLNDCFPGVSIEGGVNFFLWDREHDNDCDFSTRIHGQVLSTVSRDLRAGRDVVIRDNIASSIVQRVASANVAVVEDWIELPLPFGRNLRTNFRGAPIKTSDDDIPVIHNKGVGYVQYDDLVRGHHLINTYKVILPMAHGGSHQLNANGYLTAAVLGEPIALAPGSICTQTYFVMGTFETAQETENYAHYLTTKFVRFLVLQRKTTQHVRAEKFRFVPQVDMTRRWTDTDLYEHFGFTDEEVDHIEATIKPRSAFLSLDSPVPSSHLPGGAKHRPL
jgi:site-specific DNA-methyltransferase (adenine-specific)